MPPLTPRQQQIVDRILAGKANKEIAWELGLQENTIKIYITQIYRAVGVRSRMELANKIRQCADACIHRMPSFEWFLETARAIQLTGDQHRQVLAVLLARN